MKYITIDRISGFVFLLLSAAYGYFGQQIPLDFFSETEVFNARSLPTMIAVSGMVIGFVLMVHPGAPTGKVSAAPSLQPLRPLQPSRDAIKPMALIALIFGYASVLPLAGFLPATICFLWLAFLTMGERRWIPMTLVALVLPLAFQWLMSSLGIYLDPGDWWLDLHHA